MRRDNKPIVRNEVPTLPEKYKEYFNNRKITSFYQLPEKYQEELKSLIENNKFEKVYLTGSAFKGTHNLDKSSKAAYLRLKYFLQSKESDIDIQVIPDIKRQFKIGNIDINPHLHESILIYDGQYH